MKLIKTYNNFITESRSETIGMESAVEMYLENCTDWDLNNPNQIYRGTHNDVDYYYINPKGKYRSSMNAGNSYNSLFDVIPSWNGVPRRSESLIMANDESMVEQFGDEHHIMIPFNGSRIGVCSNCDVWNSIPFLQKFLNDDNYILEEFDSEIQDLFRQNIKDPSLFKINTWGSGNHKSSMKRVTVNRDTIIKLCDQIDKIPKEDINLKYDHTIYGDGYGYKFIPIWINKYSHMKFIDFMDFILDFEKNKFKIITTQKEMVSLESPSGGKCNELWSDGEFLAVGINIFPHFKEMVNKNNNI